MRLLNHVNQNKIKITDLTENYSKACHRDPRPIEITKDSADILARLITKNVYLSLAKRFKIAHVKPLFKNPLLDRNELRNVIPVPKLNFVSKFMLKRP